MSTAQNIDGAIATKPNAKEKLPNAIVYTLGSRLTAQTTRMSLRLTPRHAPKERLFLTELRAAWSAGTNSRKACYLRVSNGGTAPLAIIPILNNNSILLQPTMPIGGKPLARITIELVASPTGRPLRIGACGINATVIVATRDANGMWAPKVGSSSDVIAK